MKLATFLMLIIIMNSCQLFIPNEIDGDRDLEFHLSKEIYIGVLSKSLKERSSDFTSRVLLENLDSVSISPNGAYLKTRFDKLYFYDYKEGSLISLTNLEESKLFKSIDSLIE